MSVEIKVVSSKSLLRQYINFPFVLYKDDPYWTPPLISDELSYYNPLKNTNLVQNPYVLYLAYSNGKIVGRIMGLINLNANELRKESLVRWNFLDSYDEEEIVVGLLNAVEKWGKEKGMQAVVGPRGFTDQEPQGAMIEGFDERAPIGTHYNRPYLVEYIAGNGYSKDVDWVCYKAKIPKELPEKYLSIVQRILKGSTLTCIDFKTKAQMKPYILPIMNLLNETYVGIYGFAPMSEEEMGNLAKKYLPVLDPRFICVIEDKGKLVAFAITMPDITEGLKKAKGKLFPFGIFHILKAQKNSKILQLLLIGVHADYRGRGLFTMFAERIKKSATDANMEWIDSHLQLEDNLNIRKWLMALNGEVYRKYRAFKKEL